MLKETYHPGVCNIGRHELNKRKRNFFFWITGLAASAFILIYSDVDLIISVIIEFVFAFITSVMLLQITNQFCVWFGFIGKYNFNKLGFGDKVMQPDFRIADRRKTFMLLVQAILIAAVYACLFYFVKQIFFWGK